LISDIANVARWEWFKLRFRWMPWVLLALLLFYSQIGLWVSFFVFFNVFQAEGASAGFTLPGSISQALGGSQTLALLLLTILAASTFGMEYGMGTLRMVLTRGTGHWQYLAGKFLALAAAAASALAIVIVVTIISSLIASALAPDRSPTGQTGAWTEAAAALGRTWFSLIPYLAFTGLVTVLTRSAATGTAICLSYYFVELIIVAILSGPLDWFDAVAEYLLVQNILAWSEGSQFAIGVGGGAGPGQVHAFVVLLAYLVALGGGAFWLFQRRDVTGVSGG
jgi:ABC-type transport system involved in multi-copper enzyme maturation permease subunit